MLEYLNAIDEKLLLLINSANGNLLDTLMIFFSSKLGWLPLYLLLLYVIIRKYGVRSWLVLVSVFLTIIIADQASVHLFKNVFQRLRPCHVHELSQELHMVVNCGGQFGFLSSHAANSAAVATFVILILRNNQKWIIPVMVLYTFLIMYSRVYLGVHYPFDVIAGAALGTLIGISVFKLFSLANERL